MAKKNIRKINRCGEEPCTICKRKTPLEEHHLRGRDIPNANAKNNIVWICPTCHSEIHTGLIIVEGWLSTSNGRELFWHKKGEESITGQTCSPPLY